MQTVKRISIFPEKLAIWLFFNNLILLPVLGCTHSGCVLEEAAEGGLVFEAQHQGDLLFNDDEILDREELEAIFKEFDNPEMINNCPDTAPSKRLKRIIKGYNKIVYGNILAEAIGLTGIKAKCPRFNNWITIISSIVKPLHP